MPQAFCTIIGIDALTGRVKTWPQQIDSAVQKRIVVEVQPLVSHMKAKASAVGGSARMAGRTVRLLSTKDGLGVAAGGTKVLMGAEYGAYLKSKGRASGGGKKSYVTKSRKGTPYIVRRRTKNQFKPHLGNRGYWFWPTVRTDLKGINARVARIINESVG